MKIDAIYFEITNRCNLNCTDCYNSSGKNKITKELSAETIKEYLCALKEFNENSNITIMLSGGEPLLHSNIDEILDITEIYSEAGSKISTVTNGTVYNKHFYDLLSSNGNYSVQFSLDGCDEETNSLTRGKGVFEKCVFTIKNSSFINKPRLKMVISRYNKHQVEDYFKFASNMGCIPSFAFINHMGNAVSDWEDKTIPDKEKLHIARQIESLNKEYKLETNPPYPTLKCPLTIKSMGKSLLVKPDGNIHACQMFYHESSSLGNINNYDHRSFEDSMNEFSDSLIKRSDMDFGCSSCICGNTCEKGCPGLGLSVYGKLDTCDSLCGFRKQQTARLILTHALNKEGANV